MKKQISSPNLEEKIYDVKFHNDSITMTSYFPLSQEEKQTVMDDLDSKFIHFKSIFSDSISESEWQNSKEQIKKKFKDELIDIE